MRKSPPDRRYVANQIAAHFYHIGGSSIRVIDPSDKLPDALTFWTVEQITIGHTDVGLVLTSSEHKMYVTVSRRHYDWIGRPAPGDRISVRLEITKL